MNKTVVFDGVADLEVMLDGDLSLENVISGEAGASITVGQNTYPTYVGETTVVPMIAMEQVLATERKTLLNDITVKEIPVHTVTNPQGGNTVYIGGVFEYG